MSGDQDRRSFLKKLSFFAAAAPFAAIPSSLAGQGARRGPRAEPIADTTTGKVRGFVVDGINVFRGIPYGGDTGGRNRFMPPTPVQPWTGIREAVTWGRVAPQRTSPTVSDYDTMTRWFELPGGMGEDCLVLNVYTPGLNDGARRPVLFSIHGGGYSSGTSGNPVFDGVALARLGDVILVTINHRLGILGYLELGAYAPEFEGSGNVGMMDIVQALGWVRDNIESFGGDPHRVMIFGQSGGGGKVSHLLAMPSAKGLFHRAAIQSGATLRSGTREAAHETAERALGELGLRRDRFRELQGLPFETLLGVQGGRFGPFLDGDVVPSNPFDPTAPALSAHVPVIVGTDLHDNSYTGRNYDLDEAGLLEQARTMFGDGAEKVVAAYREVDQSAPFKLLGRIATDRAWRRNAITLAERKAALGAAPAYLYLLTFESVPFGGRYGSVHGTEMPLFYYNLDKWPIAGTSAAAYTLAGQMAGSYIAFARTGKPTVPGFGDWPAYNATGRATMIFDANTRVENAPDQRLLDLVEQYAVAPQAPRS
jgi:para-nitrobenzyl esterase